MALLVQGSVAKQYTAWLHWPRHRDKELRYLSICQHSCIVAFKAALYELANTSSIDLFLPRFQVKDKVIGEGLVLSQQHLGLPWRY